MDVPIHESIPLEGTAEDAPTARAAAREVLRRAGCSDDLTGDALLCLSELVTNAILHAGGSICVEITATDRAVRLEVTDGMTIAASGGLPTRAPLAAEEPRETGRGLAIVDQLTHAWGVAGAEADGRPAKKVWAELLATVDDDPLAGRPAERTDASDAASEQGSVTHDAVLLDVPIRLFLASEAHLEALLRDMQLLAAGWSSRNDRLVKGLADALRRNRAARTASMEEVRRRIAAGDDVLTLRFPVSAQTPAAASSFLDVVSMSEARTGRDDDADPALAELRHFRRWYASELTHQALGGAPRRCPFRP